MRILRWQGAVLAGLFFAVVWLVATPLDAQTPIPLSQAGGAVCPLSDEQVDNSMKAFDKLAQTFTGQPRCFNCHGAVKPFAADAEQTHGGGRMDFLVFKTVKAENGAGAPVASDEIDDNATDEQCQTCHSELPGWRLASPESAFKGQSVLQICKRQKNFFGKLRGDDVQGFVVHIDKDFTPVKFIDAAFEGRRALDKDSEGLATGPMPDPPKGITHPELNEQAKAWAAALGGKFQGDLECGCTPHHYALQVEESTDAPNGTIRVRASGKVLIPIKFADDGSFQGNGDEPHTVNVDMQVSGMSCTMTPIVQTVRWSLHGSVEDSNPNSPGTLHLTYSATGSSATGTVTCSGFGTSTSMPFTVPAVGDNNIGMPDVPAEIGKASSTDVKLVTGGAGHLKITVVQVD